MPDHPNLKIVIPGGAGQVGTVLARAFHGDGHNVVVLSRRPQTTAWRSVHWDGSTRGAWFDEIDGADVVINLAGRSVNCRYTARNRHDILHSRVDPTRIVGEAIAAAARPPRVWLQAGTATIYAHRLDAANDEATGLIGGQEPGVPSGWRFSTDVAKAWEDASNTTQTPQTRKIIMRSAMIMSPDPGGIFATLLGLVQVGLGGTAGSGRQYVSWIHEHDLVNAVRWLIKHDDISGVVNLAAPHPLPNVDFMRILRRAAGVRVGLPASSWMLSVGAFLMRTETELLLKSRRVAPGRLLDGGFTFAYPHWENAAAELCRRTSAL